MKILDVLDEKNITQVELANRLSVSRQHVSKIVKGQENLTLETIVKIEEVLEVTLISVPENETDKHVMTQRDGGLKRLAQQAQELNLGYEDSEKIKPIVYHSFAEKEKLEKDLIRSIPEEKRKRVATDLMSIFSEPKTHSKKRSTKSSEKRSKKK